MRQYLERIGILRRVQESPIREIIGSIGEPAVSLLCSMYACEPQIGADGKAYPIDAITRIGPQQGMLIYRLVRDTQPQNTLETGLAFGYSTVYFLSAIMANRKGHHLALDPHQSDWSNGIGLAREKVLGAAPGTFEFSPEDSIQGLARFVREQRRFGVIFIDGDHTFDGALFDFSLASQVCEVGGHIIFDDMWMPSLQRGVGFIRLNRSDFVEVPTPVKSLAVFKKTGTDQRKWDHFAPF